MDKIDKTNFLQALPDWLKVIIGVLAIASFGGSGLQIASSADHLTSKITAIESKIEELIKHKESESQKREKMIEDIFELKSDVKELKRQNEIDHPRRKREQDES